MRQETSFAHSRKTYFLQQSSPHSDRWPQAHASLSLRNSDFVNELAAGALLVAEETAS